MSASESGKGFYYAASYLGQHRNISRGILKKTSCMGIEERIMIGDLKAIEKVLPLLDDIENMTIDEMIEKVILPFLENEGHAKWERDVVTDMAIRKGDTTHQEQWKKKGGNEGDSIINDGDESEGGE